MRQTSKTAPPRAVRIVRDPALAVGCRAAGTIELSGRTEDDQTAGGDADRKRDLEAIAANSGANVVVILEQRADWVRARAYVCR
jgi:hypothetical protein